MCLVFANASQQYLPTTPKYQLSTDWAARKIYLKITPKCQISPDYSNRGSRELIYILGVYGR